MRTLPAFLMLIAAALASSCTGGPDAAPVARSAPPAAAADHVREVEAWRAARLERLRSESGWLTLVALHWLEPGREHRVGTAEGNELVLPAGSAPAHVGSFTLTPQGVLVRPRAGAGLTAGGEPFRERIVRADDQGEPDLLALGSLTFQVIRRGDRYGIRVKDASSPVRTSFRGIETFPVRSAYRVTARFEPYDPPRSIDVPTVLGTTESMPVPGKLTFALDGQTLALEPVLESPDATELFVIFKDATSGRETYGAGRFLYADLPKDGTVVLDFNRAYNPPCAFTPYATCPLPPRQNWLPVRIEAGERAYGGH